MRKVHDEELQKFCLIHIIRLIKSRIIRRTCSTHIQDENPYRILVSKHEGKKSLVKPRHRWYDNIKINFKK
jgi:hypothetical protein